MRRLFFITFLLAVPLAAAAQTASDDQNRIIGEVAQCIQAGLPPDWAAAEMRMDLKKPGADTGEVTYLMRRKLSGGRFETFRPCDEKKAARMLLDVRKTQPAERRAWTSARLTLSSEGTYDLSFDYSKPPARPK